MIYADVDDNGWIRTTYGSPQPDKGTVEVPDEVEPRDPSKHEKAWHWNGGNPELRETGNDIPPEPDEAKDRLLTKAETPETDGGWGWTRSKVRNLRTNYSLLFDFMEAENWSGVKEEADYAYNQSDITQSERDWIHDLVDGVV